MGEKLIELLWGAGIYCDECGDRVGFKRIRDVADHLIANDVSIKKHGRWIDRYGGKYANPLYECSDCKEKALYKVEVDVLGTEQIVQALSDVCPHCGADMR